MSCRQGVYKWICKFSLSHVISSVFLKGYTSEWSFLNLWHSVIEGVKKKIFLPIKTLSGTSVAQDVTNDDSFQSVLRARSVDKLRELKCCDVLCTHERGVNSQNKTSEKRSNSDICEPIPFRKMRRRPPLNHRKSMRCCRWTLQSTNAHKNNSFREFKNITEISSTLRNRKIYHVGC